MKHVLAILCTAFSLTFSVACSTESDSSTSMVPAKPITITLGAPKAGWDYPTDAPIFPALENKSILAINETARIVVDNDSELLWPEAGVDYPTDSPRPVELHDVQILKLKNNVRLPIRLVKAIAGIDYPTDGPATGMNMELDLGNTLE